MCTIIMCKNIKIMAIKQIYLEYFPYFCKQKLDSQEIDEQQQTNN